MMDRALEKLVELPLEVAPMARAPSTAPLIFAKRKPDKQRGPTAPVMKKGEA